MTMTKSQAGIIGVIIVASVLTPLVIRHQARVRLRKENQSLRQQIAQLKTDNERLSNHIAQAQNARAPRLPAPPMQVTNLPGALATEDLQPTNRIAQLIHKPPKLTAEQVESYLKANRRDAASLLAAYRTTGNVALLEEAMQKYPNDPQVAFEAVFDKNLSSDQQRLWLNAFEQSAPDNALANYLSALDYFKAGQADQAVQELIAASGKPQFQDYSMDFVQNAEEAYLAAGYSEAEAAAIAHAGLEPFPQLQPLRQVGYDLVGLANSYQQVGDLESAQAALQMGLNLGQRVRDSTSQDLIENDVGIAIQRSVLRAMDPNSPYGTTGQTVQNYFDAIVLQQKAFGALVEQADSLLQTASGQHVIDYFTRVKFFGEAEAAQWLVNKNGPK